MGVFSKCYGFDLIGDNLTSETEGEVGAVKLVVLGCPVVIRCIGVTLARIRVVSAQGRFGLGRFGLGRFGQI